MARPLRFTLIAVVLAHFDVRAQTSAVDAVVAIRGPVIALPHARIIDGLGRPPLENQTRLLRDGKIAALVADTTVGIPANATVRDLAGKSVIPGLVLVHEHLVYSSITKGPFHANEMEFSSLEIVFKDGTGYDSTKRFAAVKGLVSIQ